MRNVKRQREMGAHCHVSRPTSNWKDTPFRNGTMPTLASSGGLNRLIPEASLAKQSHFRRR